jgi:hypothetical protein
MKTRTLVERLLERNLISPRVELYAECLLVHLILCALIFMSVGGA